MILARAAALAGAQAPGLGGEEISMRIVYVVTVAHASGQAAVEYTLFIESKAIADVAQWRAWGFVASYRATREQ